jgi:hypothetical protein
MPKPKKCSFHQICIWDSFSIIEIYIRKDNKSITHSAGSTEHGNLENKVMRINSNEWSNEYIFVYFVATEQMINL